MKKDLVVKKQEIRKNRGITLFMAVTIMAVLLFISFVVINIAIKSTLFASSGKDSQYAFYAADAGIECAMYWDRQSVSKFDALTPGTSITCGGQTIATGAQIQGTTTGVLNIIGGNSVGGSWVFCANENGVCNVPTPTQVRYGANGSYYYLNANTSINCDNATFGDPIFGTFKSCHYLSASTGYSIFGFSLNEGNNPSSACVIVDVAKSNGTTYIKSRGYNTCDTASPKRVERGVEVLY